MQCCESFDLFRILKKPVGNGAVAQTMEVDHTQWATWNLYTQKLELDALLLDLMMTSFRDGWRHQNG